MLWNSGSESTVELAIAMVSYVEMLHCYQCHIKKAVSIIGENEPRYFLVKLNNLSLNRPQKECQLVL